MVALWAVAAAGFVAEASAPFTPQLLSPPPYYPRDEATLAQGRTLFAQLCAGCHVLDRDGLGSPLGGVTRVLTQVELLRHTHNPVAVIKSGNRRANALFRRYQVAMPSFDFLPEEQLVGILAPIESETENFKLTPFAVDLTPPIEKRSG
jgi:mono/diheme cytochrome c family protein